MIRLHIFIGIVCFGSISIAQNLDSSDQQALQQTKEFLQDEKAVQKYIKESGDPKAAQADNYASQVTRGDANSKKEMYSISASIMDNLTSDASGDPEEMQKILERASNDPEGFYNSLTPEQKARIRALGGQIGPVNPGTP